MAGLRGNRGLLLFGEGGIERGVEGQLRPLRRGAAHFALAAGVPMVAPIATTGDPSSDLALLAKGIRGLFVSLEQAPGPRRARWLTRLLR